MKHLGYFLAIIVTCCLASCSGNTDTATPRPVAYPRLSVASEKYHAVTAGNITFEVNDVTIDSIFNRDASTWMNITYPTYCNNSVIYCTITPAKPVEFDRVVENRLERIALNLGGSESVVTDLTTPDGWDCQLIRALSPVVTPLQFIATNKPNIVTGAYYIATPGDSVMPYVDAVERDIIHLLKTIK